MSELYMLLVHMGGQPSAAVRGRGIRNVVCLKLWHHPWRATSEEVHKKRTLVETHRPGCVAVCRNRSALDQRFENWKLRRALRNPYFLRSTMRLSRVK